jgi:hypothetical protein
MKAIVEQLRRRRSFGELGALTGDRVLQPFGVGEMKSSDAYAEALQQNRQKAIDDAQTKEYQTGQLGHMKEMERLTGRGQDLDYQAAMLRAAVDAMQKKGEITEKQLDTDTQKLSRQYTQQKMPQLDASISNFNNILGSYKDRKEDLPGVGYAKNLPIAKLFLTDAGKDVSSAGQAVANDLLNMYSGLAVTLPESERRDLEQMRSGYFSESDYKRAWPLVVKRYNSIRGHIFAGYLPEVQQRFLDQNPMEGGVGLEGIKSAIETPEEAQGVSGPHSRSGENEQAGPDAGLSADEQAELAALKKKHGK